MTLKGPKFRVLWLKQPKRPGFSYPCTNTYYFSWKELWFTVVPDFEDSIQLYDGGGNPAFRERFTFRCKLLLSGYSHLKEKVGRLWYHEFWDHFYANMNNGNDGGRSWAEFLAQKHESRILGHLSNPVCGVSMMEQVRLCAVWPMENCLALPSTRYRVGPLSENPTLGL